MTGWNFDMSEAPREGRVIIAGKQGHVTVSQWLAKHDRWEMFTKGESPIAWQPWPEHPTLTNTNGAK